MFDLLGEAADWFGSPKKIEETVEDFGQGVQDEGVSGLLDPVGMLDRQDAKRDLAPYFAIESDDFVGPRNHDDVTPEQFDKIAHDYSDIRLGRGDLTIDTDKFEDADEADAYREEIMGNLATLMRTTSGREQIEFLSHSPVDNQTSIRPMFHDGKGTAENLASKHEFWPNGDHDQRIYFSGNDKEPRPELPAGSDHVMLAHEMQHAHDQIIGNRADGDYHVVGDDYYSENDEIQTVGLTHSDPTHPSDPAAATENRIRFELNQLGEHWLPRMHYDASFEPIEGEERNDKKRAKAWDDFMSSPRFPGFE